MKLREETAQKLKVFLGSLPGPMALRLAEAVEADRAAGGDGLPHDLILDGLRPALARAGNARQLEGSRTESLFAELEAHGVAIRLAHHPVLDVDALVGHVRAFATLAADLAKAVMGEPHAQQRLEKNCAVFDETMEGHLVRAPRAVLVALPALTAGAFAGGPRVPNLAYAPDEEQSGAAIRYAKLVAGCRDMLSGELSLAALTKAEREIANHLESYRDNLLRDLRTADGMRRDFGERYSAVVAALTLPLQGVDASEDFRRRARSAMSAEV